MDCLKSANQCINTVMLPGAFAPSSYGSLTFDGSHSRLRTVYIPWEQDCYSSVSSCFAYSTKIPALLAVNRHNRAKMFCIHFHGNACDIGQIAVCASRESSELHAHYLLVEYPGFGVANGYSNEITINQMAWSVYNFVVKELQVPSHRIVLIGRSIGTGPACYLASVLQRLGTPPFAVVLHSPYTSIRDAASDLLGCVSNCMLDRWPNWKRLVGDPAQDPSLIQSPILFIHADGDNVINYHHSLLLHEHRQRYGLHSELFVQRSNDVYIKGHNYFDYENDVVVPTRNFLHRLLQKETVPVTTLTLSAEMLKRMAVIPPEYRKYDDSWMQLEGKDRESKYTACVYTAWFLCPCVFCAEAGCACAEQGVHAAMQCMGLSAVFNYQQLRPQQAKKGGLLHALTRRKSFDRVINEEAAAKAMQRAIQARRATERSTENPLVVTVNAQEDTRRRESLRSPESQIRKRMSGVGATTDSVAAGQTRSGAAALERPQGEGVLVKDRPSEGGGGGQSGAAAMVEESDSERTHFPRAAVIPAHVLARGDGRTEEDEERVSLNYVPG